MNGTGSGENRESAELEAVKNLSSIFGQTVKSNSLASKKMEQALSDGKISFSSSGNLQQNITSQIEAENLIGIEIRYSFFFFFFILATSSTLSCQNIYSLNPFTISLKIRPRSS